MEEDFSDPFPLFLSEKYKLELKVSDYFHFWKQRKGTSKTFSCSVLIVKYSIFQWWTQNKRPETSQEKRNYRKKNPVGTVVTSFLNLSCCRQEESEQDRRYWNMTCPAGHNCCLFGPVIPSVLQDYQGKGLASPNSSLSLKVRLSI